MVENIHQLQNYVSVFEIFRDWTMNLYKYMDVGYEFRVAMKANAERNTWLLDIILGLIHIIKRNF